MKLTKKTIGEVETYFKDSVKKYEHYKNITFGEWWSEYDEQGIETHFKASDGEERWSDKHPDNPINKIKGEVVDIEPFTFK